jgi:hypothetical protein
MPEDEVIAWAEDLCYIVNLADVWRYYLDEEMKNIWLNGHEFVKAVKKKALDPVPHLRGMLRCGVEVAWGFQWYHTTKKVKAEVLIQDELAYTFGNPDFEAGMLLVYFRCAQVAQSKKTKGIRSDAPR